MTDRNSQLQEKLGNIAQIRDILFGDQIQDYETRFQRLESHLESFQKEIFKQLAELKESFNTQLQAATDASDKKLQYISVAADEEIADLRQSLDRVDRQFTHQIVSVESTLKNQIKSLQTEIEQTQEDWQTHLNSSESTLSEKLERYATVLSETKASKDEIAELLFDLCMKFKSKPSNPDRDATIEAGRLLPESSDAGAGRSN